jgi:SAM-dependent methyltransferase
MLRESIDSVRARSSRPSSVRYDTVANFQGWQGAPSAVEEFVSRFGARNVLEIGAGANPTLAVATIRRLGVRYTTNDISADELDKADPAYVRLCHDLSEAEPPAAIRGAFDLVFSRMVNEHVRDGERYYRNIATILAPGGVTVHWFSTLYALPFLGNRLMPEPISDRILDVLAPRDRSDHEKFKAYYSWGRGPTRSMVSRLEGLGFDVLEYTGYFGHTYYKRRIPVLHYLEEKKSAWLAKHPNPLLTSYARVVLRKVA